jgi:hypothetical protein
VWTLSIFFLLFLRSKNINTFTSLMRMGGGVAGVVEVGGSLLVLVLFLFFLGGMMLTHSAALCFCTPENDALLSVYTPENEAPLYSLLRTKGSSVGKHNYVR